VILQCAGALYLIVLLQTLEFLYPLRKIEKKLIARLKQEKTAPPIYKWIKVKMCTLDIQLFTQYGMLLYRLMLIHPIIRHLTLSWF